MQIVSNGDNLHEVSKLFFFQEKWENCLKMSSAEIFTQSAKRYSLFFQ